MGFSDLTLLGVISHLQASVGLENGAGVLFRRIFLMGQKLTCKAVHPWGCVSEIQSIKEKLTGIHFLIKLCHVLLIHWLLLKPARYSTSCCSVGVYALQYAASERLHL